MKQRRLKVDRRIANLISWGRVTQVRVPVGSTEWGILATKSNDFDRVMDGPHVKYQAGGTYGLSAHHGKVLGQVRIYRIRRQAAQGITDQDAVLCGWINRGAYLDNLSRTRGPLVLLGDVWVYTVQYLEVGHVDQPIVYFGDDKGDQDNGDQ